MSVLITGAGLIGRHVASELVMRGERVAVLDRRAPPPGSLPSGVELLAGDINDAEFVEWQIMQLGVCDVVNTAAVLAVTAKDDPVLAVRTNLLSSVQLLELARRGRIRRLILASTGSINSAAFGSAEGDSIPEDFQARVLGNGPGSFYIATKLAMEHFCQLYRTTYDVSAVALRFGAVLGAAGWTDTSLVARLALHVVDAARNGHLLAIEDQRLLWEGEEEFIDPRDVARGVADVLNAPLLSQVSYNIASTQGVTFAGFLDHAKRAFPTLNTSIPVQPKGGFLNFPFPRPKPTDCSAARRDFGFEASRNVEDALLYVNLNLPSQKE